MAELKRKLAQEKLEALKKTAVGARVFADVTVEVCLWFQYAYTHYTRSYQFFHPCGTTYTCTSTHLTSLPTGPERDGCGRHYGQAAETDGEREEGERFET